MGKYHQSTANLCEQSKKCEAANTNTKGLFGWAVAVKKVAVDCEL
jgi:hypothetical protein